jgi:hypothetical protein
MLRTVQSLPQEWAFDTGLRPRPFPDEAASLLPGPLAATRTGLTPASDDELTTQDQPPTRSTSCLWAHGKRLNESPKQSVRSLRCPDPGMTDRCGRVLRAASRPVRHDGLAERAEIAEVGRALNVLLEGLERSEK